MKRIAIKDMTVVFKTDYGLDVRFDPEWGEADDQVLWGLAYRGYAPCSNPQHRILKNPHGFGYLNVSSCLGVFIGKQKARNMYKDKKTLNLPFATQGDIIDI